MDVQQFNITKAAADSVNPAGVWADAPSLAASTVAMTNNSGHTVWVDVSSGTVTVIKVDGDTTGLTSGSFRLLPNQDIAITYSVAPTVGWTYDSVATAAPVGAWADAPSLAASTVDMVNTSGRDVNVFIVGAGTVSVVKIDGVTTGLVSTTAPVGWVRLRRGGVLNLTYSVAPTLHWIYA